MNPDKPAPSIEEASSRIQALFTETAKVIVGQTYLIERLLMGLIAGGHVLVEGVPGLAKTTAVKALAKTISASFQRIQFTPDLLPADILGTQIYDPKSQDFLVKKGPLFHQIILADEINRAPAKVQSALLEAMQERQITIGEQTFILEEPFVVMATQNPIEQEGTYPLPEAQVDRFMFKLKLTYPTREEERKIIQQVTQASGFESIRSVISPAELIAYRGLVKKVHVDPKIDDYIVRLVYATREPSKLKKDLSPFIQHGASPRASINLYEAARVQAFMKGRDYVVPQDVKSLAMDVLRHRIILTFEAEAEGITTDQIVKDLLDLVEVP